MNCPRIHIAGVDILPPTDSDIAVRSSLPSDSLSSSIESHYLSQIKAAERVMHFFNIPFSEYKQDGGNDD